ncbi:MAG: hypothetical protein R3183_09945 [Oleiphilaceae bacterium]|nr:hypothetical protein [Oleiphilaceae bacterium]
MVQRFNHIVTACALALVALGANAEAPGLAHIASPEHYQRVLENDHVLVLKMVLRPGEVDRLHRHHNETVYFQKGGQLTITEADGHTVVANVPDGHVMWHQAWSHQVRNTGESEVVAIIVEDKTP